MTFPKTGGPEWAGSQASPWTPHNEAMRRVDALSSRAIIVDRDLDAAPGSCADGANYLIAATPAGGDPWEGQAGKLATAVGTDAANGWLFQTVAVEGYRLYVQDEDVEILHDGSAWTTVSSSGNPTESIIITCSDETTAIASTGTKITFRMPYAFTLTGVKASVNSPAATGTLTIDINEGGASILSTLLTIDATEETSASAATPAVISDPALADDAKITIDLDDDADGTATGLKVTLIGYQP